MAAWRAPLPVANSSSVSLVEVSESTVMALKDGPVPAVRHSCSTAAGNAASVKTNASMVAMSGAIMPEPLAMPLIVTLVPSIMALALASLG